MDISFFNWLEALSPWWWVALGFALAAAEMLVFSFFLMWPAIAAFIMALTLWIFPDLQGELQITIFAVLSIVLVFVGRRMFQRNDEPDNGLNQRTKQIIGKHAKVISFDLGEGQVSIAGLNWAATWPEGQTAKPGQKVTVLTADGMSLTVENV
ncbi:MAG: NfeD family protein [Paracoccaceae bacterium]